MFIQIYRSMFLVIWIIAIALAYVSGHLTNAISVPTKKFTLIVYIFCAALSSYMFYLSRYKGFVGFYVFLIFYMIGAISYYLMTLLPNRVLILSGIYFSCISLGSIAFVIMALSFRKSNPPPVDWFAVMEEKRKLRQRSA